MYRRCSDYFTVVNITFINEVNMKIHILLAPQSLGQHNAWSKAQRCYWQSIKGMDMRLCVL